MGPVVRFIALSIAFISSAQASSNEQFVKQVERHVAEFHKDEKAAAAARRFCALLSEARRGEEPRCVALQKMARGETKFVPTPHRTY